MGNGVEYQQSQHQQQQPHNRLPAKDMPSNTVEYMNDEQIHANYIPKKN
jgi:hypothetical protein